MRLRLLISAGRADEYKLAGASAKKLEIAFDVSGSEGDPVDNRVKRFAFNFPGQSGIIDVQGKSLDSGRELRVAPSSGKDCEVETTCGCKRRAGGADDSSSANEKNFHSRLFVAGMPARNTVRRDSASHNLSGRRVMRYHGGLRLGSAARIRRIRR